MSTYFGWQRVIWFHQLLMQYKIFWQGMRYELMHYELVYCTKPCHLRGSSHLISSPHPDS